MKSPGKGMAVDDWPGCGSAAAYKTEGGTTVNGLARLLDCASITSHISSRAASCVKSSDAGRHKPIQSAASSNSSYPAVPDVRCHACSKVVSGPIVGVDSLIFHPECYRCAACSNFLEDGQACTLGQRPKLFCCDCSGDDVLASRARVSTSAAAVGSGGRGTSTVVGDGQHTVDGRSSGAGLACSSSADVECVDVRQREMTVSSVRSEEERRVDVRQSLEATVSSMDKQQTRVACAVIVEPALSQRLNGSESAGLAEKNGNGVDLEDEDDIIRRKKSLSIPVQAFKSPSCPSARRHTLHPYGSGQRQCRRDFSAASQRIGANNGRRERSNSLPRRMDSGLCDASDPLGRSRSFRSPPPDQRVFRPSDLVRGELLGTGFFGKVFKVQHKSTGEEMVLKELYRLDETAQASFLKEVAVLRSLCHVNVLGFIGVLYQDWRLHLIAEFVAGGTLWQWIHGPCEQLSWPRRVARSTDIAAGMAYLHASGVIHRDLNSHNCLVRTNGTVVVADFGLARIVSQRHLSSVERRKLNRLRRTHRKKRYTVVGNPFWMAPEMMCGHRYDEKVDVFSFGIVLCEIISRVAADPDEMPRRSSDFGLDEDEFRRRFGSECPEPLLQITALCCNTNPDLRPAFSLLERWLSTLELHTSPSHASHFSPPSSHNTTPTPALPIIKLPRYGDLLAEIGDFASRSRPASPCTPPGPSPLLRTISAAPATYLCVDQHTESSISQANGHSCDELDSADDMLMSPNMSFESIGD